MKRILLFCDGTWNRADQQIAGEPAPTNVIRAAYLSAKAAGPTHQVIFYDQGVGTGNALDRWTGGAFGAGLEDNLFESYRFLVANYEVGDELYLFGFSRGAFTARSIAGMIRKCGILRRGSVREYKRAVDLYRDSQHPDLEGEGSPVEFRKLHSIAEDDRIPIRFIGVWDTVGALGIPIAGLRRLTAGKHEFHDTELSGTVQFGYHALAIDEHRKPFEPTLWRFQLGPEGQYEAKPGQVVEQMWFAGSHSDVGGGFLERGLSDVTLTWMLDRARDVGLEFDTDALAAYPVMPDAAGPLHDSKRGLFRFTGGMDREIGQVVPEKSSVKVSDPTQRVHESVLQRWDGDAKYRPRSLRRHFQMTQDPRAAD